MAQTFQPGTPAPNSVPQSVIIRDNLQSLLTCHAGASVPAYAAEGMVWYDTTTKRVKKIAALGSKARGVWAMGAQINLAVALRTAGLDGSLITADVRLQDSTLLPSANHAWTLTPTNLLIAFRNDTTPAYFAGRKWNDTAIDEPIFWTTDGKLLGKSWESIPNPNHENNYGSGPLANVLPFADTSLRSVGIEHKDQVWTTGLSVSSADIDHVVVPLDIEWWEFQNDFQVDFYEDGAKRHPDTFKVRPFYDGVRINLVVYNIEPLGQVLQAFNQNTDKEIIFRKNT